ncbi:MAG TPA: 6-carboxytetrahydropterin synthase [Syntrophales bacterium]|nr:6-carboxytetrahydropterin synthase [Syntrophales bacterium]
MSKDASAAAGERIIIVFTVAVRRHFTARHFQPGSRGGEGEEHPHSYLLEIRLEGTALDSQGYLLDLLEIERRLDGIVDRIADRLLNDLPEFAGLSPTMERLADQCCRWFAGGLKNPPIASVQVRVFENEDAWAACRREVP